MKLEDLLKMQKELIDTSNLYADALQKVNELKKSVKELRDSILNTLIDSYRLERYTLDEITNDAKWEYAFYEHKRSLLKMGFTLDELNEFIKFKKTEAEKENEDE